MREEFPYLPRYAVKTHREIAKTMGISERRVGQLERSALRKIKEALLQTHPQIKKEEK